MNGATKNRYDQRRSRDRWFPIIPPQVNGATFYGIRIERAEQRFPIIPPQVNGATHKTNLPLGAGYHFKFPIIPPQVNGATQPVKPGGRNRCLVAGFQLFRPK